MGFIGSMFSGNQGMGWRAGRADIQSPISEGMISDADKRANAGLDQQRDFVTALQGQNGIGNQSNVFNQMQGTANQYQNIANGTGPNPALAQLNQATAQNIANQSAMMAGQRGASQNIGLMSRQIANQGADLQQKAAGQGAIMQAQQQIAGLQGLQQQQNMMGNVAGTQVNQQANATNAYTSAAQAQQQALLNAIAQQNNARVSSVASQNAANANIQAGTGQQQGSFLGGMMNGFGAMSSGGGGGGGGGAGMMAMMSDERSKTNIKPADTDKFLDNLNAYNFNYKDPANGAGPQMGVMAQDVEKSKMGSKMVMDTPKGKAIDTVKATGPMLASLADLHERLKKLEGVRNYDSGGYVQPNELQPPVQAAEPVPPILNSPAPAPQGGPSSMAGQFLNSVSAPSMDFGASANSTIHPAQFLGPMGGDKKKEEDAGGGGGGGSSAPMAMSMSAMYKGGPINGSMYAAKGKKVPGKAETKGDSLKNDKVKAMLSPGEIIIPRSIANSKDAPEKAKQFVAAIMAKNKMRK